jgi:hypothetical protein
MPGDFFNSVAGGASILGAFLAIAGWLVSRGTTRLIREGNTRTQELLREGDARTQEILREMHAQTQQILASMDERHGQLLERIDERADARHRDTLEILRELREE